MKLKKYEIITLSALRDGSQKTSTQLSAILGITKSGVTSRMNRMRNLGVFEKPTFFTYRITEKGLSLLSEME